MLRKKYIRTTLAPCEKIKNLNSKTQQLDVTTLRTIAPLGNNNQSFMSLYELWILFADCFSGYHI